MKHFYRVSIELVVWERKRLGELEKLWKHSPAARILPAVIVLRLNYGEADSVVAMKDTECRWQRGYFFGRY